jgi:peptidoglycan/xylan/chitin deacetylase (PgdA/CDA1 family)
MKHRALLSLVIASACVAPDLDPDLDQYESPALQDARTIVSLTFDDTFADNYQVGALAVARGLRVTFYVNSGRLGLSGYMTRAQVEALETAGHEIGGHTVSHANLATLATDEVRRQVCNDRVALLNAGFVIRNFAYPFSGQNSTVRNIVAECGYNSGRLVGGLVSGATCASCPYANTRPPADAFQILTNESVKSGTTLAQLQQYVTQAEQRGGGWVPLVFHHVCSGCSVDAVSVATLTAFMDWLAARGPATQVGTVGQVIGGSLKPGVSGPPVGSTSTSGNLLRNASLEADSNGDQIPDCWQRGGNGTNAATFSLVRTAFDGFVAQRITMTSFTSGARRLVSQQDLGGCAPAARPGHRYTMSAYYMSNVQPIFSVYYRTSAGGWVWFAQSAPLPTSSSYRRATYTTPALPSGATAISIGLSLMSVGTLTTDAYTLYDLDDTSTPPPTSTTDTTRPTARIASPSAGATVRGITTIVADVSDNVGVYRVRFYLDGRELGTRVQTTYRWNWDTTTTTVGSHQLAVQAEDAAGNATRSASVTVNVVR